MIHCANKCRRRREKAMQWLPVRHSRAKVCWNFFFSTQLAFFFMIHAVTHAHHILCTRGLKWWLQSHSHMVLCPCLKKKKKKKKSTQPAVGYWEKDKWSHTVTPSFVTLGSAWRWGAVHAWCAGENPEGKKVKRRCVWHITMKDKRKWRDSPERLNLSDVRIISHKTQSYMSSPSMGTILRNAV